MKIWFTHLFVHITVRFRSIQTELSVYISTIYQQFYLIYIKFGFHINFIFKKAKSLTNNAQVSFYDWEVRK